MTYINKFHELGAILSDNSKVSFKYVLWYQEYLKEKQNILGINSKETAPQLHDDEEDYLFLKRRLKQTFEKIVTTFESVNFCSDKFKEYRKKYRNSDYLPILTNLDSIYETARNYNYNYSPKAANKEIKSFIASWSIVMKGLHELELKNNFYLQKIN